MRPRLRAVLNNWTLRVTALTVLAAALRLYHLTDKSIWYDEAFVITLARMSVPDIIQSVISLEPHPPLYFVLMHFWLLLGSDPFMVRLPSAILGALTVPLLYATGRRMVGRPAAFIAAALLAVAPFHVYWAQQARMYVLLGFLCLASTYFLIRAFQGGGRVDWVAHVVCASAAMYTQNGSVFYLFAQDAAVVWLLLRRPAARRLVLGPWLLSQLSVALLFVPWLPAMLHQNEVFGDPGYARTNLVSLEALILDFVFGWVPFWRLPADLEVPVRTLLLLAALGTAGLGMWVVRKGNGPLLTFVFAGTVGLLALVSLWRGLLLSKSILQASLPMYVLLGAGLTASRRVWLRTGFVLMVGLSLVGVARMYALGPEEDWRGAVAYLAQEGHADDLILVDAGAGLMPLNYYLEREGMTRQAYGVPFRFWANTPPPLTSEDFQQADALIQGKSEFWLLIFRNFSDHDGQLLPYLTSHYTLSESAALTKVRLYKFTGNPAA